MPVKMGKQFIDVNFEQAVPVGQSLGLIYEPSKDMFARAPAKSFSSYAPLIPRIEWPERARLINPKLRKCIRDVKDQGDEGSCVFNSVEGMWQFVAAQQFGWDLDYVILSAIIGYSKYGSSPGSGSMVGDSIKWKMEEGGIPETGHGYSYPHMFGPRGFYEAREWRKANPTYLETAKNFMALEFYRVESVEEWATALLLGHPITKGRSGHCIFDFIWEQDENGKWHAGYCNSWKKTWGDFISDVAGNGLGWDSEGSIDNQSGYALVGVKVRDEIGSRIIQPAVSL